MCAEREEVLKANILLGSGKVLWALQASGDQGTQGKHWQCLFSTSLGKYLEERSGKCWHVALSFLQIRITSSVGKVVLSVSVLRDLFSSVCLENINHQRWFTGPGEDSVII